MTEEKNFSNGGRGLLDSSLRADAIIACVHCELEVCWIVHCELMLL